MKKKIVLCPERVEKIFRECLFGERGNSSFDQPIRVEGLHANAVFSRQRLQRHRKNILRMLGELSPEGFCSNKWGLSAFRARVDKNGVEWTDSSETVEKLFQLGIAIGRARSTFSRELWGTLPHGEPYYAIDLS